MREAAVGTQTSRHTRQTTRGAFFARLRYGTGLEALNNELAGVREAMQRHYSVGEEALGLVVKVGDGFVGFNDTNIIYNFATTDVSEVLVSKTIERAEASHEASATNQTAGLVLPIPGMPGALDSQGGASSIKMS